MDSKINVLFLTKSLSTLITWGKTFLSNATLSSSCFILSSVLSVCDYKINIQSSHQSSQRLPGVLRMKVPGANVSRNCRFVTTTQRTLFLLLRCFFGLSKVGMWGLSFSGKNLCLPDLHHLWVSCGAPPPLGNQPTALRRLANASSLRWHLAGWAPPFSAFLPSFLLLSFVVGRAGAFPFLFVCGWAVASLLLLRRRRAGVIPWADLYHQWRRLQKAPRGLWMVWMEPLGFSISGCDAFLTSDPVWGNGICISPQHGLLIEFPGTDIRLKRERWPGWATFPCFPTFLPFSCFVFGAASVRGGLSCFLPLLGTAPFGDSRATAASPAGGGFTRSNGNMFLGLCLRGSLWFIHLPGTNLGHIVEVPSGLRANGWLAATHLWQSSNENHQIHLNIEQILMLIKLWESKIGTIGYLY